MMPYQVIIAILTIDMRPKLLPVYYGRAKLNKIAKREALTVIFLNGYAGPRIGKDGHDGVTRFIEICAMRYQTEDEVKDAEFSNRIYSVYNIFMDDKAIKGSLDAALRANYEADSKNVSEKERKSIREKLKSVFMKNHPDYREPTGFQLQLNFEE